MSQSILSSTQPLLSEARLGSLTLRNRVVMAPMTRSRAGAGEVPGDLAARYYSQRASAGLIITEATQVSPQGIGYIGTPGIYTPAQVDLVCSEYPSGSMGEDPQRSSRSARCGWQMEVPSATQAHRYSYKLGERDQRSGVY